MQHDPFMLSQYHFESPPRYWKSNTFPNLPVDPDKLSKIVIRRLQEYGNAIPEDLSSMIQQVCKTFNESIRVNKEGDIPTTLILSPKTGSGKSTIAKSYVSLLSGYTSLIIVPRVSDAIEFCEDIKNFRGESEYAKCIYKVSDDNPDSEYRVAINDMNKYSCIIMTHKMFQVASDKADNPVAKRLKQRSRDLVIVDERLQLQDPKSVDYNQVESFMFFLQRIQRDYTAYNFTEEILQLSEVLRLFEILEEERESTESIIISLDQLINSYSGFEQFEPIELKGIHSLFDSSLELNRIYNPSSSMKSEKSESKFRTEWLNMIYSLNMILKDIYYYYKSGQRKTIGITNNIRGLFDSIVVLDATAEVNEYYNTLAYTNHMTVQHIETDNPRSYENLTFHVCSDTPQGKSSIVKEKEQNAQRYMNIAHSLITDKDDKLLIVSHKDFSTYLKGLTDDKNIYFTHWGNHVGKNEWSHCNKVLIIGWYYLPINAHYDNIVSAVGDAGYVAEIDDYNLLNTYSNTQLADDLVQAVMRCRARVISDADGNCKSADIYICTKSKDIETDPVLKLVFGQFKNASLEPWLLPQEVLPKRKSKSEANITIVIDYLKSIENTTADVSQATIVKDTPLSKSAFSRLYNSEEFEEALADEGFSKCKINGRSNGIRLES